MPRHPVLSELIWPDEPGDGELAVTWAESIATEILGYMWRSFDVMQNKYINQIDLTQPLEQLERELAKFHFLEIQQLFRQEKDGFASFSPVPEWPEMATRSAAPAKPPAYDFAFICLANSRWAWPIEAKVIHSNGGLVEYLKDINEKFFKGVASPLVSEGGMIGYLLVADVTSVWERLQKCLKQRIEPLGVCLNTQLLHGNS